MWCRLKLLDDLSTDTNPASSSRGTRKQESRIRMSGTKAAVDEATLSEVFNRDIDAWARRAMAANGFGDAASIKPGKQSGTR